LADTCQFALSISLSDIAEEAVDPIQIESF
jgi:hypothetical protein